MIDSAIICKEYIITLLWGMLSLSMMLLLYAFNSKLAICRQRLRLQMHNIVSR